MLYYDGFCLKNVQGGLCVVDIKQWLAHEKEMTFPDEVSGIPVVMVDFTESKIFNEKRDFMNFNRVVLPDSIEFVGINDFRDITIREIHLGASITNISAFKKRRGLKKITLSNGNRNFKLIDGNLYTTKDMHLILGTEPRTIQGRFIGSCAFYGYEDESLELFIPESVDTILNEAFAHTRLKHIQFHNKISYLGPSILAHSYIETIVFDEPVPESDALPLYLTSYLVNTKVCHLYLPRHTNIFVSESVDNEFLTSLSILGGKVSLLSKKMFPNLKAIEIDLRHVQIVKGYSGNLDLAASEQLSKILENNTDYQNLIFCDGKWINAIYW